MSEIISDAKVIIEVVFTRTFDWPGTPGSGFGFPSDNLGVVDLDQLAPAAIKNFNACRNGEIEVIDRGVVRRELTIREPAQLRCDCGDVIWLSHFTNTCSCGRDYDMSGQLLASRAFWGEETGESASDILGI